MSQEQKCPPLPFKLFKVNVSLSQLCRPTDNLRLFAVCLGTHLVIRTFYTHVVYKVIIHPLLLRLFKVTSVQNGFQNRYTSL